MAAPLRVESDGAFHAFAPNADEAGLPLAEFLARRGLPLNTRCGGRGLCSGCEIELQSGTLAAADGARVTAPPARRLKSCQHRLAPEAPEVAISLPARSVLKHAPAIVSEFHLGIPWAHDPLEPHARYGAAVDVGTTTVALALCDLATGRIVAEASQFNGQLRFGEDVVTRIQLCCTDRAAIAQLQHAVARETIQPLLERAARDAGVALADIGAMTVAGNTTMQHLLAGVDPSALGTHPFTPAFLEHRVFPPAALGLHFGDARARVHLLPGLAAYVGADLAAGLIATGMNYEEGPSLLVDVGTNGEIVAQADNRLLGCATAAGPAFEGAGLSSGCRAVRGAIERIALTAEPFAAELGLVGGPSRPLGICGSAYIDFLWEGRRTGLLDSTGRFNARFAERAAAHLAADAYGRKLRLHADGAAGPIWISEADVARLLQAKAAIAAGIATLLQALGLEPGAVRTLYLAGGFGLHLSLEHAIGCGLLPGFRPEQIKVVGNSSLGGAFLALHDRTLLADMTAACARMQTIELNQQPGFEDAYIDHLALP